LQVENLKLIYDIKAATKQKEINNLNNNNSHNPASSKNLNNNNNNNKYSQRLNFINKEEASNLIIVRDKAQKIVSVTEMGGNTNSVHRIIHCDKDSKNNNNNNNNNNNFTNNNNNNNNNRHLTECDNRKKEYPKIQNNSNREATYYNNGESSPNKHYSLEENNNYLEYEREKRNILEGKVNNESGDWTDLLKQSNMNREEFNYYSKNRGLAKIIDLIENSNKLLRDKNFQIRILLEENKDLNLKNEDLDKENTALNQQNMHLLRESIIQSTNNDGFKYTKGDKGMDSSLVIKKINQIIYFNLKF
jgi:hypothetical protein